MADLIQFDFNGVAIDSTAFDFAIQKDWDPRIKSLADFQALLDINMHDAVDRMGPPKTPFPSEKYLEGLSRIPPMAGFAEMLQYLRDLKKRLLVNTSAGTYNIAAYSLDNNLHFDTVLGHDFHRSKAYKSHHARTRLGVEPHRTVFVTDSCGDIHDVRKDSKEITIVATSYGVHDRNRLLAAKPHFIVDTVAEMRKLLTELDLKKPLELRTYSLPPSLY